MTPGSEDLGVSQSEELLKTQELLGSGGYIVFVYVVCNYGLC